MSPTDRPRSILATLPVVAGMLLVVLAVLTGVFEPLERGVQQRLGAWWPDAALSASAVLVEVDAESIDRLGPLPWTPETWGVVSQALGEAGVAEVAAIEPLERLLNSGGAEAPKPDGARLVWVGSTTSPTTELPAATFEASELRFDLPTHGGVITGLGGEAVGTAWCAWARCPSGSDLSTPLRAEEAAAMPRISLGGLLVGDVRTVVPPGAVVILGISDPRWAQTYSVGASGASLTRGEVVALSIETLASRPPRRFLPLGVLLPLIAVLVLVGALVGNAEPVMPAEAWLAVLPTGVVIVCVAGTLFGVVVFPVVTLSVAAVVGPLAEILRLRARTARFIRRMSLQLARADVGLPTRSDSGIDPQTVLRRLSALTWNHLPTDRMMYISTAPGEAPKVVGGFGLAKSDLRPDLLTASGLERLAAQGRCDELVDRSTVCASVVSVHRGVQRLGYWVVAWIDGDLAPSLNTLKELARWNDEQGAAGDPTAGSLGWLLRMDRELDAISGALARNTQARSRQGQLLQEMNLPLAFADRAGRFVFKNAAFLDAFDLFDEEVPQSVRQLVHARCGGESLSRRMRRVFVGGETERVAWPEVGRVVCVAGVGGEVPTGVVVWIEQGSIRRAATVDGGACPVQAIQTLADAGRIEVVSPTDIPPVGVDPDELRQGVEDLLKIAGVGGVAVETPKVVVRNVREGVRVSMRWRGLALDETIIGAFGDGAETAELHRDLIPFARARRRFPDLRLVRGPGRGVQVVFTLPRVSLAS